MVTCAWLSILKLGQEDEATPDPADHPWDSDGDDDEGDEEKDDEEGGNDDEHVGFDADDWVDPERESGRSSKGSPVWGLDTMVMVKAMLVAVVLC